MYVLPLSKNYPPVSSTTFMCFVASFALNCFNVSDCLTIPLLTLSILLICLLWYNKLATKWVLMAWIVALLFNIASIFV